MGCRRALSMREPKARCSFSLQRKAIPGCQPCRSWSRGLSCLSRRRLKRMRILGAPRGGDGMPPGCCRSQ